MTGPNTNKRQADHDLTSQFRRVASLDAGTRGRRFEEFFDGILKRERLSPRRRYRPSGEEIDGSFVLSDRVYLIELKWEQKKLPASTLYEFRGKVEGKLEGTLGVLISMSGYSNDAIDALVRGKTTNIILFDQADVEAIVGGKTWFRDLLRRKLRVAAERGLPYKPFKTMQDEEQT